MVSPGDQLTILLTLRGRHAYTRRWLEYANHVRFPFAVHIADGSLDDHMTTALADATPFPHVRYEYRRYPPDRTYTDFYAKVADALSRVQTPFVAMGDNDDFFVVDGLSQAVTWLAGHPDYATCGGQMASFWVDRRGTSDGDPLYGDSEWKCSNDARALDAETARDRLHSMAQWLGVPIYHHVRRTTQLAELFRSLRTLDLKDLFLHELFLAFLTATGGKIRQLDVMYMAKQLNSSGSAAGAHLATHGDWLDRMFAPSWSGDFARFLDRASTALSETDGIPAAEAQRHVADAYRTAVAPVLVADLMTEPTATVGSTIALGVTRRLLAFPSEHPVRRFARAMYRRIPWISPDVMQGTELRGRLVTGAAGEIGPIHEFLTNHARLSHARV